MIQATCHCGAVRFQVERAPETVTSCNCSICRRTGGLWAYYQTSEVLLATPDADLGGYVWGDKMLTLHHCRVCGCITHWSPLASADPNRMGINARLFEPQVLAAATIRKFDGADTWTYLD